MLLLEIVIYLLGYTSTGVIFIDLFSNFRRICLIVVTEIVSFKVSNRVHFGEPVQFNQNGFSVELNGFAKMQYYELVFNVE